MFDLDDAGKLPYESPVMDVVELDGFDLRPGPLEEFLADGLGAEMGLFGAADAAIAALREQGSDGS